MIAVILVEGKLEQQYQPTSQTDIPELPRLVVRVHSRLERRVAQAHPIIIMILLSFYLYFGAYFVLVREEGEIVD